MMMKIEKGQYSKLLNLYIKQEWLQHKEAELLELINFCEDFNQQDLICDLLYRFKYLKIKDLSNCLRKIVENLDHLWKLDQSKTQIVAITFNDDPDSAQMVLQFLKPVLKDFGWNHVKLVNSSRSSVKNIIQFPNVVFIDEFIGTGTTMKKRIKDFTKLYDDYIKQKKSDCQYTIRVCAAVAMKAAKENNKDADMFAAIWLDKGISDFYNELEKANAIRNMVRLESLLDQLNGKEEFPSLGWGGAETLYTLESSNTPNSVFPIFWWETLPGGTVRKTILKRF